MPRGFLGGLPAPPYL